MKIGEAFRKAGLISSVALKNALKEQETTHDRLGDIFLRNGIVTTDQEAPVLADYFNTQHVTLQDIYKAIDPEVFDQFP